MADSPDLLQVPCGISSKKILPLFRGNSTVSTAAGSNLSMFSKKAKMKPDLKIQVKDPSPKNPELIKSSVSIL
jgi:hypothetical protein